MEWVGLAVWLLLAAFGLPLAALGAFVTPTAMVQALAAVAGLALCVSFIVLGGGAVLAWGGVGAAVVGAIAMLVGSPALISEDRKVGPAGQAAEEHAATLGGIQGPLFGVAVFVTLLAALGMTVT
jgi:hypothetical protein